MAEAARSIGIAFGTKGVAVAALDDAWNLLAIEGSPLPVRRCPPPAVRQRPADWIEALRKAFAMLRSRCALSDTAAFSVAGTAGTLLAVAADGTAIGDALMHDDASGARHAGCTDAVAPISNAQGGPTPALARALWIWSARHPAHLAYQADWIAGQLSGRFAVTDESNALTTGYDPTAKRWPDWIDGLSPALRRCLPHVVAVGDRLGTAAAPLARELGLPSGALCVAGCTEERAPSLAADISGTAVLSARHREPAVGAALLAAFAISGGRRKA